MHKLFTLPTPSTQLGTGLAKQNVLPFPDSGIYALLRRAIPYERVFHSEAGSTRFIALLAELPIVVEQEPPERMIKEIFSLARKHKLSSYDASYLDLAMRKGLPIATLDKDLLAAANRAKAPILKGNMKA